MSEPPRSPVAVIVPVRNNASIQRSRQLQQCVAAIEAQLRPLDSLCIVDDGSNPPVGGPNVTRQACAGPAVARNLGASQSEQPVVCFVDSDVIIGPGCLDALASILDADAGASAVQAVYAPEVQADSNFVTRFMALLSHYNFTSASDPQDFQGLSSFCVAIRRTEFERAGGFDTDLDRPTMEDDNLGHALRSAGGRVRLAPEIQVDHLAEYTVSGALRRMFDMASDKLLSIRRVPSRARVRPSRSHHRPEFLAATILAPSGLLLLPIAPPVGIVLLAVVAATHAPLIRTAADRYGVGFAVQSIGMLIALAVVAAGGSVHGLIRPLKVTMKHTDVQSKTMHPKSAMSQ
jgi:hypothetical protein